MASDPFVTSSRRVTCRASTPARFFFSCSRLASFAGGPADAGVLSEVARSRRDDEVYRLPGIPEKRAPLDRISPMKERSDIQARPGAYPGDGHSFEPRDAELVARIDQREPSVR